MKTFTFILAAVSLAVAAPTKTLTLIYTNDLHGELLPTPDWTVPGDPKPELGGLDKLETLIKTDRAAGPCVVLDAGDFACGSPEANHSRGMLMIDLLSRIGYDAVCVGERDIPFVTEQLDTIAQHARFRLLGERALSIKANVDMPVTRPSLLRDIAGVKIGLIGILDDALIHRENDDTSLLSAGLTPEQILAREIKSLRSQNADIIIVLAHMPIERCQKLASRFPDVTAFICGHDGWVVEPRNTSQAVFPLILEAGRRGQRAGVCHIYLDSALHKAINARSRVANLLPVRAQPDSVIRAAIMGRLVPGISDSIAYSAVELDPGIGDYSPLGAWVAANLRRQTDAAVILPFAALDWALLKGVVTERAIRRIVPYDETLVKVKLGDLEAAQVLDELLTRDEKHLPIAAGIAYDVVHTDSSAPQLRRRAINVTPSAPRLDVILPRWLALSAGLPSRDYASVKENYGDLLVAAVKNRGIVPDSATPKPQSATPLGASGKVNINTATEKELETLPGIGPAFADRIIKYRQQHGPFASPEDLMNVKGLGQKRYEKLKDKITI